MYKAGKIIKIEKNNPHNTIKCHSPQDNYKYFGISLFSYIKSFPVPFLTLFSPLYNTHLPPCPSPSYPSPTPSNHEFKMLAAS